MSELRHRSATVGNAQTTSLCGLLLCSDLISQVTSFILSSCNLIVVLVPFLLPVCINLQYSSAGRVLSLISLLHWYIYNFAIDPFLVLLFSVRLHHNTVPNIGRYYLVQPSFKFLTNISSSSAGHGFETIYKVAFSKQQSLANNNFIDW